MVARKDQKASPRSAIEDLADKNIDSSLMQNKTGNINVHIMQRGDGGRFSVPTENGL